MSKDMSWTIHVEFMVLLVTLIGGFYLLDGKIERACMQQSIRTDSLMTSQNQRTDRLYEMFIDLVKEKKSNEKQRV